MNIERLYNISVFDNYHHTIPKHYSLSFDQCKSSFTKFLPSIPKEHTPGFIGGKFTTHGRKKENLESRSLLTLDIDHAVNINIASLEAILRSNLKSFRWVAYATSSYTSHSPKIRLILFFVEDVPTKDFKLIATNFISNLSFKNYIDIPASTNPVQLMLHPTKPLDAMSTEWTAYNEDGEDINPMFFDYDVNDFQKDFISDKNKIKSKNKLDISHAEIISLLKQYEVNLTTYKDWLMVGMALHHQYDGSSYGKEIWLDWSLGDVRYPIPDIQNQIKSKWDTFGNTSNPLTFATIISKLKSNNKDYIKSSNHHVSSSVTIPDKNYLNQLLPSYLWKHTTETKNPKPYFTRRNFEILLEFYNISLSYDVILKDYNIYFNDIKQNDFNDALTNIELLCKMNLLETNLVHKTVLSLSKQNIVNSWRNWIESKPYDGHSRFQEFCDTVSVSQEHEEIKILYLKRWLIQMLHQTCLNDAAAGKTARMVLIFQGRQHIGKTSWFCSLVPDSMRTYIADSVTLDVSNHMSILTCIKKVFVELGEIDSTFRKSKQAQLKGFLSACEDELNIKYIANPVKFRRQTVFFGSVNPDKFLNDPNGNSRFLTLPVLRCNARHNIDMQQLYAELYIEAKATTDYHLNDNDLQLQSKFNQDFVSKSAIEEKFYDLFDLNMGPDFGVELNATQLLEKLGYSINIITKKHTNEAARLLNDLQFPKNKHNKKWKLPPLKNTVISY